MTTPLDPAKKNSIVLTEGPDRAAARSYFRSVGFSKEDLHKPLIGIANTWTEIGPCNFHLRQVAEAVKQGIREAGGMPVEFNTITIHDGITMGTQGMKASLISREVIADSIELVTRGNSFDGLVCIAGCDKNMPASIMALARLSEADVETLLQRSTANPQHKITINVEDQTVTDADGFSAHFEMDPFRKYCLVNGLDDIGLTLRYESDLDTFEAAHDKEFWSAPKAANA